MTEVSFLLQLLFCWIVVSCFLGNDNKYDLCLGGTALRFQNDETAHIRFDMIGPPVLVSGGASTYIYSAYKC